MIQLSGKEIARPILMDMWIIDKRKKSKKIWDCYSVLASVAAIWQFMGTFPIEIIANSKKCRFSKSIMVYNIILFAVCVATIAYSICQWNESFRKQSLVMSVTTLLRIMSSLGSMLMTSFMWIFYHKHFEDAVDFLASQHIILNQLGCQPNYANIVRTIRACVYGTLVMLILLNLFNFYLNFAYWPTVEILPVVQIFFWSLPLMIQVITPTIFMSLVIFLALHFRELNTKLLEIITKNNTTSAKVIQVSNHSAELLRLIAKVHYNLCKIAKFINWNFSGILVIIVVEAFIILSSSLYFIFNEVVKDGETDYYLIGTCISWQITHAVPIIMTVIICNWTSNEAAHTGKLIHQIHVESTESQLYQIIRSLSLQLHHQKIEFSGAGLFPINSSLLQTMIGNMTTSLVILIQFQPSLEYH